MKINEMEALVGITKKNIRFYEEKGLLKPRRNRDNGYRDYEPEEAETLRRIKLMRKLGVPLEEIRAMQEGERTLGEGMRRHLTLLEKERRELEQSVTMCQRLRDQETLLEELDAQTLLEEMERMERGGAAFPNKQQEDVKLLPYVAPVAVAVLMTVLMAGAVALLLWAFAVEEPRPPLTLMVVLVALPVLVLLGVYLALIQRLQEIKGGEADEARKY